MLTFSQAETTLGTRESKNLENNTKLIRLTTNQLAVTLHGNTVVRINRDGTYVLHTCGWHTATTKDRLNKYSPCKGVPEGRKVVPEPRHTSPV